MDLKAIVNVHLNAFPDFFMSKLGPRFLHQYYRCILEYPRGLLVMEESNEGCIGFVAGFVDSASFYRELQRRRIVLSVAACVGILRRPHSLIPLLANERRTKLAARLPSDPNTAELSSLAVLPDASGLGVGSRLLRRFVDAARDRGAAKIVLTTDADDNGAVNQFYQKRGFALVRTFEARRGRRLNEYAFLTGRDST